MSAPNYRLRRNAARSFILYGIDMAAAIAGWVYGFGLTVHNWVALIGICLLLRWVFSMLSNAFMYQDVHDDVRGRDYLAAQAMQGLMANPGGPVQANGSSGWSFTNCDKNDVATLAYVLADAMLKASKPDQAMKEQNHG